MLLKKQQQQQFIPKIYFKQCDNKWHNLKSFIAFLMQCIDNKTLK